MAPASESRFRTLSVPIFAFFLCLMLGAPAGATTIWDPSGDSTGLVDITSVTAQYDATTLFFSATFAPSTLNPYNLALGFALDTDLNITTGGQCPPLIWPCGGEWSVRYQSTVSYTQVQLVSNVTGTLGVVLPVTFGANSVSIAVPLDPDPNLGLPDDGLALFGLVAGVPNVLPDLGFFPNDFAPASGGPLGGPSSFIPEPGTALLIATGLAGLAAAGRRRSLH